MIYLIEPNKDSNGHFTIYLKSLLNIKDTCALQLDVDIRKMAINVLSFCKYYFALRKQLKAVPVGGGISHILYSDLYYKIPFVFSNLFRRNKTIVTMHSFPNGKLKHFLMKNFCKRVDMVIVHSLFIKHQMEKLGLRNVVCIDYPSFYDYKNVLSRNELKKRENISPSDIVLSALGGIRYDKGLDILLDSFRYIRDDIKKKIILNIAGIAGFLNEEQIRNICEKNGIRARLVIRSLSEHEFMENVEISDYMVMPYRSIMTGNSGPMTEAIVRQIPSIVPKGSNLGYIVENYNVGITFIQEDPKDLARVIEKCCRNKYICKPEYSQNLKESVFINKHRDIYQQVMK